MVAVDTVVTPAEPVSPVNCLMLDEWIPIRFHEVNMSGCSEVEPRTPHIATDQQDNLVLQPSTGTGTGAHWFRAIIILMMVALHAHFISGTIPQPVKVVSPAGFRQTPGGCARARASAPVDIATTRIVMGKVAVIIAVELTLKSGDVALPLLLLHLVRIRRFVKLCDSKSENAPTILYINSGFCVTNHPNTMPYLSMYSKRMVARTDE
jgi:hypothetical protein